MISTDEQVVLVDAQDTELGTMEKLEAHVQGKLHRAFSILIFNDQGEYLLQKEQTTNTILVDSGQIQYVVIPDQTNQ